MGSKQVMDRRASQNEYLHKDFHGAFYRGLEYLDATLGPAATESYLRQMARTLYGPLMQRIVAGGLAELEQHLRKVLTIEKADFGLRRDGSTLVLELRACPAVGHLLGQGIAVGDRLCRATHIINDEIAAGAGLTASVHYDAAGGSCIQSFTRGRS